MFLRWVATVPYYTVIPWLKFFDQSPWVIAERNGGPIRERSSDPSKCSLFIDSRRVGGTMHVEGWKRCAEKRHQWCFYQNSEITQSKE